MERFVLKVIAFVGIAFGLPILCAFGPIFIGGKLVSFKCPHATTVLIGDSTCEYGLDDSLLPGVVNMGHSASSIPHSYWRLKKYLDENPQTKRVVFVWQPKIFTSKHVLNYGCYTSLKHLPFMSLSEIAAFYGYDDFKMFFKAAYNGRAKGADPFLPAYCIPRREYWGRYRKTDIARVGLQRAHDGIPNKRECLVEPAPEYWVKLVNLVAERNAELVILLPPLYHYDEYFDREAEMKRLRAIISNNTKVLDYTDFPILEDEFRDVVHLNSKGARRLSVAFAQELSLWQ